MKNLFWDYYYESEEEMLEHKEVLRDKYFSGELTKEMKELCLKILFDVAVLI